MRPWPLVGSHRVGNATGHWSDATGSVAMKTRHSKAAKPKPCQQLTATPRRLSSAVKLQKQPAQRTREPTETQKHLFEALEQQAATDGLILKLRTAEGFEVSFALATENAGCLGVALLEPRPFVSRRLN